MGAKGFIIKIHGVVAAQGYDMIEEQEGSLGGSG